MNVVKVDASTNQLPAVDKKEIQGIVEYWKQSFLQLKTFDMEVICTATIDAGVNVKDRLVYRGRLVYDASKHYYKITLAATDGKEGLEGEFAFDGHYYWNKSTDDRGRKTLIRDVKVSFALINLNPLMLQYSFAFDLFSTPTFPTFYEPETWGFLQKHIVKVEQPTIEGKARLIFHTQNKKTSVFEETVTELYTVKVAAGEAPYPSFWESTSTKSQDVRMEFIVNDAKKYSHGALQFFFPIRINSLSYLKNTLVYNYIINIPTATLKINQPVDSAIFTLKPDKDTEVINADEVKKKLENKEKTDAY